jgi:hypothetical protein
MRNKYKSAVWKPQETRTRRRRGTWSEDNVKMNLSEMVHGNGNWIEVTQYCISY